MLSKLAYSRTGGGEPLVLIHGIGHRWQAWEPVIEQLSEHFDVIALDLPGFGASPALKEAGVSASMENVLQAVGENFEEWGIERPHVVGNSLGGAVALYLGDHGLARSVVALSPAGFFGPAGRVQAVAALLAIKLAAYAPDAVLRQVSRSSLGRKLVGFLLYSHPERYDADRVLGDALSLKRSPAFWPTLVRAVNFRFHGGVRVPTTIAWGTKDRLLNPKQAAQARRQLPDAVHVPLVGAGHVPMGDCPEEIARIVHETVARGDQAADSTPFSATA
ncbi:alpha/beta fold hydrolase [Aeromicrobium phragmitis]|uniref:Alpha/beta fold hydrolase n=1 Tax=Aeromicrobium phragmitis TaxID=2478914 RepID=A0A3L8PP47_9ACTN|nr:alpha/beta fold hydrolase [Aeromicrobium phragmitis]RLV57151.1 alpha/beta fold hydrolase [Aeromicrobium phragmitis]